MDGQMMYRAQWLDRADTADGLSFYVNTGKPVDIGGQSFVKCGEVLFEADAHWHPTKEAAEAEVAEQCMRIAARLIDQAATLRRGGAA